jgi:hypothetical protein
MHESVRRVIERGDPGDPRRWAERLENDRITAAANQTAELRLITGLVLSRAIAAGAVGVALTGSTARAKRTSISDLDYHVVGRRPDTSDLPADVDIYESEPERMRTKLLSGDDFVQWTICCGCILYDRGIFREAATMIVSHDLWPDGVEKLRRLTELRRLADRLIAVGDRDAAQDHVRATLTSAARGLLLQRGIFALARSELPQQLRDAGNDALADALTACIYEEPSLAELRDVLRHVEPLELAAIA